MENIDSPPGGAPPLGAAGPDPKPANPPAEDGCCGELKALPPVNWKFEAGLLAPVKLKPPLLGPVEDGCCAGAVGNLKPDDAGEADALLVAPNLKPVDEAVFDCANIFPPLGAPVAG